MAVTQRLCRAEKYFERILDINLKKPWREQRKNVAELGDARGLYMRRFVEKAEPYMLRAVKSKRTPVGRTPSRCVAAVVFGGMYDIGTSRKSTALLAPAQRDRGEENMRERSYFPTSLANEAKVLRKLGRKR